MARFPRNYPELETVTSGDQVLVQQVSDNVYKWVDVDNIVAWSQSPESGAIDESKIDYSVTGGVWWELLGRHTLTGNSDDLIVQNIPDTLFLQVLVKVKTDGVNSCSGLLYFNSDGGTNYSYRYEYNGAADVTAASQTYLSVIGATTREPYTVFDIINYPTAEKLVSYKRIDSGTAGAGNTPNRTLYTAKWANTSDYITTINYHNTGIGFLAAGSEMIVLGHN